MIKIVSIGRIYIRGRLRRLSHLRRLVEILDKRSGRIKRQTNLTSQVHLDDTLTRPLSRLRHLSHFV